MDIEEQKNVDYTKKQKLGIDINSSVQNIHGGGINIRDQNQNNPVTTKIDRDVEANVPYYMSE